MPTLRRVFAFLACFVVLGTVGRAEAQSVTLNTAGITHTIPRDNFRVNTLLNYADCIGGDAINFPLSLTSRGTYTLEVWVGTGCTDPGVRTSVSQTQCWLVHTEVPSGANANSPVPQISVASIVAGYTTLFTSTTTTSTGTGGDTSIGGTGGTGGTGGSVAGASGTTTTTTVGIGQVIVAGPEACVQPNPEDIAAGTSVTVSFMLIDPSTNAVQGTPATWEGQFKLVGPPPPDQISAGIGGGLLVVNFSYSTPPVDTTVNTYNLYCDPPPGTAAAVDAGLADPDGGVGTATACGVPQSQVLIPGMMPPAGPYLCGSAQRTSQTGNATNLVDGVPYNIAIAATDTFENVGTLSLLGCGVPQPVTGFFQAYRDAGGKAGGGYCSFSMKGEPSALFALLGLASCLVLRRRRAA